MILGTLFLLHPLQAFAIHSTDDSLVGYWKFDELSPGSFTDSSRDGHPGTGQGAVGSNNTPQPSTDVPSGMGFSDTRSLSFDGTDDYVSIPDSNSLDLAGNFTISVWAKRAATATNAFIISKKATSWTQTDGWMVYQYSGGVDFIGKGNAYATATGGPTDTGWHHYAIVMSGGTVRFYIDSSLKSQSHTYVGGSLTAGTDNVLIGKREAAVAQAGGFIDDLRIYNRAISAREIAELAAGQHPQAFWAGTVSAVLP